MSEYTDLFCLSHGGLVVGESFRQADWNPDLRLSEGVFFDGPDHSSRAFQVGDGYISLDARGIIPLGRAWNRWDPTVEKFGAVPLPPAGLSANNTVPAKGVLDGWTTAKIAQHLASPHDGDVHRDLHELGERSPANARMALQVVEHRSPYIRARAVAIASRDRSLGSDLEKVAPGLPEHLRCAVHVALLHADDRAIAIRSFEWLCARRVSALHAMRFESIERDLRALSSPAAVRALCSWMANGRGLGLAPLLRYLASFRDEDLGTAADDLVRVWQSTAFAECFSIYRIGAGYFRCLVRARQPQTLALAADLLSDPRRYYAPNLVNVLGGAARLQRFVLHAQEIPIDRKLTTALLQVAWKGPGAVDRIIASLRPPGNAWLFSPLFDSFRANIGFPKSLRKGLSKLADEFPDRYSERVEKLLAEVDFCFSERKHADWRRRKLSQTRTRTRTQTRQIPVKYPSRPPRSPVP